ncbi:MAG: DUF1684 domain-containing protein [Chitinophagaceae bacterium]
MKQLSIAFFLIVFISKGYGQDIYKDSLTRYIDNYVEKHEVVTGEDKKQLHFYPVNEKYHIKARFEKVKDGKWFSVATSGTMKQVFRVYGTVYFTINDTAVKLNIYQSQRLMAVDEYKDNLFLPFTDLTTGYDTYAAGRYIDLVLSDVKNNTVVIDFNKAYNPYCAYVSGKYNCPIPPRENDLSVAILAGEKNYTKAH